MHFYTEGWGHLDIILFREVVVDATVTTDPATVVGTEVATLNGTLNDDGGEACQCRFRYGVTPALGSFTPFVPGVTSMMPISATIL
ncbi:unnamed protein product, partial [marine sediment metagenome]